MLPSSFQISKSPVVHFDRDADDDAKYIEKYVDEGDYNEDADDAEVFIIQGCPGQTDPWAKGRAGL